MKYSIFHTSHCGSTLLACMLSNSIDTVTEPTWSHNIRQLPDMNDKMKVVNENHKDNLLVKYSSLVTDIAPNLEGKKVFLYRNILDHLSYLKADKNEGKFWLFRWHNLLESKDVLYLPFDIFMYDKEKACQDICNHFGIEYKPTKKIDFHVKEKGYNHNNNPIKI